MPDSKISNLPTATTLDETEVLATVQSSTTKQVTVKTMLDTRVLYKARITQSGTSAPVITEYLNPTGLTITGVRTSTGLYNFSGFTGETFASGGLYEFELNLNLNPTNTDAYVSWGGETALNVRSYSAGVLADTILGINHYSILTVYKYI